MGAAPFGLHCRLKVEPIVCIFWEACSVDDEYAVLNLGCITPLNGAFVSSDSPPDRRGLSEGFVTRLPWVISGLRYVNRNGGTVSELFPFQAVAVVPDDTKGLLGSTLPSFSHASREVACLEEGPNLSMRCAALGLGDSARQNHE